VHSINAEMGGLKQATIGPMFCRTENDVYLLPSKLVGFGLSFISVIVDEVDVAAHHYFYGHYPDFPDDRITLMSPFPNPPILNFQDPEIHTSCEVSDR